MFSFICGEVVSVEEGIAVLKCGDIGFELCVSDFTALDCGVGDSVQLYTYLQVKEDGLTLYGFSSAQEKKIFMQLITVSGIGCKMALAVLSNCSINDLATAIATGNTGRLSGVKGIGKKTAERIVLELKEKIAPPVGVNQKTAPTATVFSEEQLDAIAVLTNLGISRVDAENRAAAALSAGFVKAEEIINFALKNQR